MEPAEGPGVSAQVGEWLKPADCKSAPPSEVRRFESSPVHQYSTEWIRVIRLALALAAYVVLGVLVWTTISDPRIRLATLAVVALFVVKTLLRRKEVMHSDADE